MGRDITEGSGESRGARYAITNSLCSLCFLLLPSPHRGCRPEAGKSRVHGRNLGVWPSAFRGQLSALHSGSRLSSLDPRLSLFENANFRSSRRGAAVAASSPLIKPDGRIYRIRLTRDPSVVRHAQQLFLSSPAVADPGSANGRTTCGPLADENGVDYDAASVARDVPERNR